MAERVVQTTRIYEGRVVNLRVDEVELSDGARALREVVEHAGSVAVVPVDGDGNVILVKQYRHPAGRELLEIPAGTREPSEDALACVQRELAEETGYTAARIEHLVGFFAAPGFCTEYLDVYMATDLQAGLAHPEDDEGIEVVRLPLAEALALVARGAICDGKSIVGLLVAAQRLGRQ
jgi:ADP-ribose pyrophosphatase